MALSQAHIDQFQRDGFLCLDLGLDPALPERIIAEVTPRYGPGDLLSRPNGTRIQDAWQFSPAAMELALHPAILSALGQLYGRRARAFQTLNFPVGTEQKTHSDTIHFNSDPAGFMAGVWVALEDIDERNGALKYYPGSHRLPEVTMQDVGAGLGYQHYPDYEAHIESLVEREGLMAERGRVARGEVFIWHGNLLHGGGSHPDRSRTRHSQVTHYFFEGCRYYTPMNSSPDQRQWRDPVWIGESERPEHPTILQRAMRRIRRALTG